MAINFDDLAVVEEQPTAAHDFSDLAQDDEPLYSADGRYLIHDGDTIRDTQTGEDIRLAGLNTSETAKNRDGKATPSQFLSGEAKQALKQYVDQAGGNLQINRSGTDPYGRSIADITDGNTGLSINSQLVRGNLADKRHYNGEGSTYMDPDRVAALSRYLNDDSDPIVQRIKANKAMGGYTHYEFRKPEHTTMQNLGAGVARGIDNLQATLYGATNAFGEMTGIDLIAEWGEEGVIDNMKEAAMNPAEIKSWDDVDSLASFGTYVVETLGEQAPNLLAMATGAGVGAVAARAAVGKAALKHFSKKLAGIRGVEQGAAERLAAIRLGKSKLAKASPALGTAAVSYPMAVGEVQNELKEGDIDAPGTAFLAGIPIAGLDAISFNFMVGHLFGGLIEKKAATNLVDSIGIEFFQQLGMKTGKGMLKGAGAEIPTEMAQELITISARAAHDPEYEIFSEQNLKRIREAGIKAGIVGAAAGGAGGGVGHILDTKVVTPEQPAPANEAPSTEPPATEPPSTESEVPSFDDLAVEPEDAATTDFQQEELPLPTPDYKEPEGIVVEAPAKAEQQAGLKKVKLVERDKGEADAEVDPETVFGMEDAATQTVFHSVNARTLESDSSGNPVLSGSNRVGWKPQKDGTPTDSINKRIDTLRKNYPGHDFGIVETEVLGETRHLIEETVPPASMGGEVENSLQMRQQMDKIFDDGKRTQDKRAVIKSPEGKNTKANLGEVSKLGAIINGFREGSRMEILRDNFMSGVSYMMDKGYDFNDQLKPSTVVAKMGGRDITFSELSKVKGTQHLSDVEIDSEETIDTVRDAVPATANEEPTYVTKRVQKEQEDTTQVARGLETDEKQAGKSAADRAPGKGRKTADVVEEFKNGQASVRAKSMPKETEGLVDAMLKHVGLKTRVRVFDEDGMVDYIAVLRAENTEVSNKKADSLEKALADAPDGRIIYNDIFDNLQDRIPTIFVSMNAKNDAHMLKVLSHELGHLVQRAALDTASKQVQDKLREAFKASGDHQVFEEWFANQLYKWALTRKQPSSILDKFFKGMANKLRRMWNFLRRKYGNQVLDDTFADYMDAMVAVRMNMEGAKGAETKLGKQFVEHVESMVRSPSLPKRLSESQSHADFTPDQLFKAAAKSKAAGLNKLTAKRRGKAIIDFMAHVKDSQIEPMFKVAIQSSDSWMRGLKSEAATWIADQFHHRPGDKTKGVTLNREVMRVIGPMHEKLAKIGNMMPRIKNKLFDTAFGTKEGRLDKNDPRYKELTEALMSEKFSIEELKAKGMPEAVAVREYLNEILKLMNELGIDVREAKNYFPHLFDVDKILNNEEAFRKLLESELQISGKKADKVIEQLRVSNGVEFEISELSPESETAAPVFGSMNKRSLNKEQQAKFREFYQDDIMGILHYYTDAAVRRAVYQKRFNPTNMKGVDGNVDPMLLINQKLQRALDEKELTREEISRIRNKVLPAYMGRLGANGNPAWRKTSGFLVMYQNLRLLGFVVLTSLVDAGFITYRSGDVFALPRAMKSMFDKASREELYENAKLLGSIRDDLTEHILNDPVTQQYIAPNIQNINEYFFRFVRMHQWTNMTRVMALATGKHYLAKHAGRAAKGDKKSVTALAELGTTFEEVLADSEYSSDHMKDVLNRFIDESVLRPDATQRPPWASDPNYMIFSHLKSFMWSYQEIILRRVWADMKNQDSAAKMVLPLLWLGMATLPIAALGYDIRRRISYGGTPPKNVDLEGWDYFWEVTQRSGALGIFQLYADADQAEEFGRFSIISLLGPTMSQFEEFLTKDVDYAALRAVPGLAQSSALRAWLGKEVF